MKRRLLLGLALGLAELSARAQGSPDTNADRIRHVEELLEKGDTKAAEPELKALAAASPKDARVQFDLGFTEEHNGEDAAAVEAYKAASEADPNMAEPTVALGLLEARAGDAGAARGHLDAGTKMKSASPALKGRALRALARLDEAKQPDLARDELLQAAQLTGEQPGDAELGASLAARAGAAPDAEAAYRRILVETPGDVNATVGLAASLAREGKLGEADALLEPALAAHPDDPGLAAEAAAVYGAEGKNAEALALLQKVRGVDAKAAADPAMTRMLAHLELVTGDPVAAEPLYRALVARTPSDPLLLDDFGSALVRQNKFPEAEAVLARAAGMRDAFHDDSAWGDTEGHLAFAASRNHHPEVALQALSERAKVLPNSPASLFLEATSFDALHQYKQALNSYRAFLAAANGKLPDEEFEARHRMVALQHEH